MNRAVEQALASLVPSLNILPPELISYAHSLLSQSHSKASTLKAEEEAARIYACANLACERLKQKLQLPKVIARPPCAPRVYKKLLVYLDAAMPAQSASKDYVRASTNSGDGLGRSTQSQSKHASKQFRLASKRKEDATNPQQYKTHADVLQDDVVKSKLPIIRKFCMVYDDPGAIPHVCAGVRSILATQADEVFGVPSQPRKRGRKVAKEAADYGLQLEDEDVPALVFVVLLLVRTKLGLMDIPTSLRLGVEEGNFFAAASKTGVWDEISSGSAGFSRSEELWTIGKLEWVEMDWYQNIRQGELLSSGANIEPGTLVELGPVHGISEDEGDQLQIFTKSNTHSGRNKKRKADDKSSGRMLPGLGTMFCPAVDWLSDQRRAQFEVWHKCIVAQIASMS